MHKISDLRLPRLPVTQWVMIALIVIAITVAIHEVQDLKQQIRQANYAAVVSNLRAALIERWVETQVLPINQAQHKRLIEVKEVRVYSATLFNPMRLLKQLPENYLGALNETPSNAKDVWFFNIKQNCLVYIDASGEQIPHPLVKGSLTKGMLGEWDIRPATISVK